MAVTQTTFINSSLAKNRNAALDALGYIPASNADISKILNAFNFITDQEETDTTPGSIVHDISVYGFSETPKVIIVPKSGWGVYVDADNTDNETITLIKNPQGRGTIKYDLILLTL